MFILRNGDRIHRQATAETVAEIAGSAIEHMDFRDDQDRAIATEAAYIAAEIALELRDSTPLVELTAAQQPTIFEGVIQ